MAAGRCFFGSQYYGGVEVAESAEGAESQTCLASRCRTDVFDDCAAPRLFVDIVKLPLKPPPFICCRTDAEASTARMTHCMGVPHTVLT